MRHYIWYATDGTIGGQETHQGGFPPEVDLADAACEHPLAVALRAGRIQSSPDFAGFVAFDCACEREESDGLCRCVYDEHARSYVENGQLVARPALALLVDGVSVASNSRDTPVLKTPGADVTVKLQAQVPDGTVVEVTQAASAGPEMVPSWPIRFVFQAGETNVVTLVAPLKGMVSGIGLYHPKWVAPTRLFVKGW